jgi:neutral trehalase
MYTLLWTEEAGCWYDYDVATGSHRAHFFPSNVFPLYVGAVAASQDKMNVVKRVVAYLQVSIF